jgi:phasin family protein
MQATTEQIEKVTDSLVQACSDMNVIVRDSWNAALQSASVVTKGCEEVCESVSSLVQKSLEQSTYASRALMSAKTMRDLMDTHSSLLKNGFDSVMEELNKISQISARIAQQATEPVTNNVNATINKISKSKAA